MNLDLLQYERFKQKAATLVPPKIENDYSQGERQLHQFIAELSSDNLGDMKKIVNDFTTGASGKSADKIKENLEKIGGTSFYSSTSFGF